MATRKRLGPDDITAVWFAPEQLRAERVQAAVDDGATAQEVADLSASAGNGEYREWLGEEIVEGVSTPQYGERLVWVHPVSEDDGWYEKFTGADEDYQPVIRAEG
jgi:hypothetical protein